jgi:hypothetical protein
MTARAPAGRTHARSAAGLSYDAAVAIRLITRGPAGS